MSISATRDGTESRDGDPQPAPTARNSLFVIPRRRGDGFQAAIRGHILDLAEPCSHQALAPTPDDLFIASIASGVAWSARCVLRSRGLPDDVSVSANWQALEDRPGPVGISLTVAPPRRANAVSAALTAALENGLAARSLAKPVIHISFEGGAR
jgi:uncharacterized OsmC-like protein